MIKWQEHNLSVWIEQKPSVMYGKPIIKNTRVPVKIALEKLAQGETIDGILEGYQHISCEAVYACLSYATTNSISSSTEGG